jgi:hypothetical protein
MSRVQYNGQRLIPAPFVSINKTYNKTGNGDIIGKLYSITVNGTLVAHMGSPSSSGTFWAAGGYPADETVTGDARLKAVLTKQEAIRELFSTEGYSFEIQSADGSQPVTCNPRITDISFEEGLWYERCNYTISLECDELYPAQEDTFTGYLESASEDWSLDNNEQPESLDLSRTYTVSHTVSAVGKKFYDETGTQPLLPWQYAREWVQGRLGFDATIALSSGVNNLPSYYTGWDHSRTESIDEQGGSYSVTESWMLASGSAIESFDINEQDGIESPYPTITVQGNIQGFEQRDSDMALTTTKWANAQDKFTQASGLAYLRAQQYSGYSLNLTPISWSVGKNPLAGTIDYSFEYNSRPMTFVSGVLSENISINDNVGGELFASVFVLGRTAGPVLQNLSTKPANTRSLNVELVVSPPTYTNTNVDTIRNIFFVQKPSSNPLYSGSLQNLITAADPGAQGFTTSFKDQPQESWDFQTGRYSYSVQWTYE